MITASRSLGSPEAYLWTVFFRGLCFPQAQRARSIRLDEPIARLLDVIKAADGD
jgi:hypothetical protein